VEDFRLPPSGTSQEKDFDLLCHIDVDPELTEEEARKKMEESEPEDAMEEHEEKAAPRLKKTVPRI